MAQILIVLAARRHNAVVRTRAEKIANIIGSAASFRGIKVDRLIIGC